MHQADYLYERRSQILSWHEGAKIFAVDRSTCDGVIARASLEQGWQMRLRAVWSWSAVILGCITSFEYIRPSAGVRHVGPGEISP